MKKVEAMSGQSVSRESFFAGEAGAEADRLDGGNFDGVLSATGACHFLNEEYKHPREGQEQSAAG
jgi:hypothetical protein